MCLITRQIKPTTAVKDIAVYKQLIQLTESTAKAAYMRFSYELNVLYKTDIMRSDDMSTFDRRASEYILKIRPDLKDLIDRCVDKGMRRSHIIKSNGFVSYGRGFHSCLTLERINSSPLSKITADRFNISIYECTIPKGSEYYTDGDGLIVSNQITVNRKLEKKEYVPDN